VLRHDTSVGMRRPVDRMTLAQLRRITPGVMTMDQATSVINGRMSLLLDVKSRAAGDALALWLRDHKHRGRFAVCSADLGVLDAVRQQAPSVPRVLTIPDVPPEMRRRIPVIARELTTERNPQRVAAALRALITAFAADRPLPARWLGPFQGIGWHPYMTAGLARMATESGISGLAMHHWLITEDLVRAAHGQGLQVTAWTVNRAADARRVAACGVDNITSDRPVDLRAELAAGTVWTRARSQLGLG
jgi:glycerophosphoryl diester phosphodiesterase